MGGKLSDAASTLVALPLVPVITFGGLSPFPDNRTNGYNRRILAKKEYL